MNESKIERIDFYSKMLSKQMHLLVYLPINYEGTAPLPVLYFLHGRSGDENIMYDAGINITADCMIKAKEIKPLIIVCPRFENSRGINSSVISKELKDIHGRTINVGLYEDYFINEVVPLIDQRFNTIRNRKGRFIGGASAGGYAALHNVLRHQEMFAKAGGHMPALELKLEEEDKPYFEDLATWEKYDPIYIARTKKIESDIDFFLDAGDKDEGEFYTGCSILYKILKEKETKSQYHIFSGYHNIEYIKSNMRRYLKFYGL